MTAVMCKAGALHCADSCQYPLFSIRADYVSVADVNNLLIMQEELQREVARQFAAMRDGAWHVLDARQSEDALHVQVCLTENLVICILVTCLMSFPAFLGYPALDLRALRTGRVHFVSLGVAMIYDVSHSLNRLSALLHL